MPRILVADDDVVVQSLIDTILVAEGFRVVPAAFGRDALRLAQTSPLALVIVDQRLPDVDGLDLARRIRALVSHPILMLSAQMDESLMRLAHEAGVTACLGKPFRPAQLRQQVIALIGGAAAPAGSSDATP
ncbi:MAG: response regulator [Chloroflexota bacterium]